MPATTRSLFAFLLGLGGCSASTLIVCVQEAQNLADLDAGEKPGTEGSDAFVAVFVSGDTAANGDSFRTTPRIVDSAHPVWNTCFSFGEGHSVDTPVSFVVLDADLRSGDDVIGTACTRAASGQRWLQLTGPAAADTSDRGRLKVRTLLIDAASTVAPNPLGNGDVNSLTWTTVVSADAMPVAHANAATASIACADGDQMVGCTCDSSGFPGCASAHMEYSAVEASVNTQRDVCIAKAHAYVPRPPLPLCRDTSLTDYEGEWWNRERPGVTCRLPGAPPRTAAPVHASARCVRIPSSISTTATAVGGVRAHFHDEASTPSRMARRDATEAVCSSGLMTSCGIESAGGGLGTRFEDGDGDGRPECVAYSDGDSAVTAQTRCAHIDSSSNGAVLELAMPVLGTTALDARGDWTAVACPPPFRLAGCACFSENGNCFGAKFSAPPSGSGGGVTDVCNVSQQLPAVVWRGGAEAHAMCLWWGAETHVIGRGTRPAACVADSAAPDKAWLPRSWREELRVESDSGNKGRRKRVWDDEDDLDHEDGDGFGAGFAVGLLVACLIGMCCMVLSLYMRARQRAQLGGAPVMPTIAPPTRTHVQPTAAVGYSAPVHMAPASVGGYTAPVMTSTASDSAPLVLSDSAACNAFHADTTIGSRV